MFRLFNCLCCQSADACEERLDTRQFTRFPSTYHLRTLFDEYRYIGDSEDLESSDDDFLEDNKELESIIEGENESELDGEELEERFISHRSRLNTEGDIDSSNINSDRTSSRASSSTSRNHPKNKKKYRKNYRK